MERLEYDSKIWPFYCRIENDFINTLNYISFSEDNFLTYSIEYERLMLSICSEIDILFKQICKVINEEMNPGNISEYFQILKDVDDLLDSEVFCELSKQKYSPFSSWSEENSPNWWKAYNKIKHDRISDDNYKLGNLENVFYALAGLYILNRIFCKLISSPTSCIAPITDSTVFSMVDWDIYIPMGKKFYQVIRTDGSVGIGTWN